MATGRSWWTRAANQRDILGETPLHLAARLGHIGVLRLLLGHVLGKPRAHEHAHVIDSRDTKGNTPLWYTPNFGGERGAALISTLLDAGANPNASSSASERAMLLLDAGLAPDIHSRGDDEMSVLHYAAKLGSAEAVSLLINKGLAVDLRDKRQRTPLHHACGNAVTLLLESGADIQARDINQMTSMHHAASRNIPYSTRLLSSVSTNCSDEISVLAEKGASVEARDIDQKSPLHHAVQNEDPRTRHTNVLHLLKNGASLNPKDSTGRTPLQYMFDQGDRFPHWETTAVILIKAGADVNGVTSDEGGLVHSAALGYGDWLMPVLLDVPGVDINARDNRGRVPLHSAIEDSRYGMEKIKLLADRGADVNAKDINGKTPLHDLLGQHHPRWQRRNRSSRWRWEDVFRAAEILIKAGADVNAVDNDQVGLLHLAVSKQDKEVLALLLDVPGVDVNARDFGGETPLHRATHGSYGGAEEIKLLVDKGADVNAKNTNGETPLDYFLHWSRGDRGPRLPCSPWAWREDQAVQILIKAGADVRPVEKDKLEFLHLAASGGSLETLALLLDSPGTDINARDSYRDTPLHHATQDSCYGIEKIKPLAEKGADVNAVGLYGRTPLHYLLNLPEPRELEEKMRIFIKAGADVNIVDKDKVALLHRAASRHGKEITALLLDAGADINACDGDGRVPVHHVIEGLGGFRFGGNIELQFLVDRGANVNAKDVNGRTPLQDLLNLASDWDWNWGEVVEILIEAGADVNAVDNDQVGLLHIAASKHKEDIIGLLLEAGADINARDGEGRVPLHHAIEALGESGDNGELLFLVDNGANANVNAKDINGTTPLQDLLGRASDSWDWNWGEVVERLIDAGADINAVDNVGVGLLHVAASKHDEEIIALLLVAGADINARDSHGRVPLHHAIKALEEFEDNGELKFLVDNGANVNAKDANGKTPLRCLFDSAEIDMLEETVPIFIEAGADVNAVDNGGVGLLHLAASRHSEYIMTLLVDAGIDINARDGDGRVPLHYAIEAFEGLEDNDELQLLLDNGANVHAKDINGRTPLRDLLSRAGGSWECDLEEAIEILIGAGADVNAVDNDNVGLLHLAASRHGKEVITLLLDAGADIHARDGDGQVPLHHAGRHMTREKAEESTQTPSG